MSEPIAAAGLTINGSLFQQGLNNPHTADFSEATAISFSGTWINPSGGSASQSSKLWPLPPTSQFSTLRRDSLLERDER